MLSIVLSIAALAALAAAIGLLIKNGTLRSELAAARAEISAAAVAAAREQQRAAEAEQHLTAAQSELISARLSAAQLSTKLEAVEHAMAEQKAEYERITKESETRFSELAAKVLADNSEALRKQSVNTLGEALRPVRDHIENFRREIADRALAESNERRSLKDEVLKLNQLSVTVSRETQRLTDALRGNAKMQGDWGEMILSAILEQAGLQEGRDFVVQPTFSTDDRSRLRPDVILNFSDDRKLIIDSKVSIQDYLKMLNAETPEARAALGKAHVESVRKHVNELRRKDYQDCLGAESFDYILMFIPHEGAFMAAVDLDPEMWQNACRDKILIVSPAQLVPIAQTVERLWRQRAQDRNSVRIAEETAKMLEKLMAFLADFDKLGTAIENLTKTFAGARGKLVEGRGNVVRKAEDIQRLGVKIKKTLPASLREAAGDDDDEGSADFAEL